jgi:acyl-[acyl-carrier-protein]-phospholipid O-acyltransferase/long-chain-fatty-acid--[acyl-carrier-protein] ligase
VGRFFPGIQWRLEEVPGVTEGGRLHVTGPNVMLGYLRPGQPGELEPPASQYGLGWYDTGDIVRIDEEGFVSILGRVKRFAKIGGEMVSLNAVEELAARIWPGQRHAAVALSDPKKGEKIILATEYKNADRAELTARAQQEGLGELYLPKDIRVLKELPLLATGKVDYPALTGFVREGSES